MAKREFKLCPWCGKRHWKVSAAKRCYKKYQKKQRKWTVKEVS